MLLRRLRNPGPSESPTANFLWRSKFLSDINIVILEGDGPSDKSIEVVPKGRALIPSHAAVLCTHSSVLRTLIEVLLQSEASSEDSRPSASQKQGTGTRGQSGTNAHGNRLDGKDGPRSPHITLRVGQGQLTGALLMLQAMYDGGACLARIADAVKLQATSKESSYRNHRPSSGSRLSSAALSRHHWIDNPLAETAEAEMDQQTHVTLPLVPAVESDDEDLDTLPLPPPTSLSTWGQQGLASTLPMQDRRVVLYSFT